MAGGGGGETLDRGEVFRARGKSFLCAKGACKVSGSRHIYEAIIKSDTIGSERAKPLHTTLASGWRQPLQTPQTMLQNMYNKQQLL